MDGDLYFYGRAMVLALRQGSGLRSELLWLSRGGMGYLQMAHMRITAFTLKQLWLLELLLGV